MQKRKGFAVWVLALMPCLASAAPATIELFAGYEDIKDAVISPDGRYLAVLSNVDGRRLALVKDLQAAGKLLPVMTADANSDFDLEWCRWATATRLLCGFNGVTQFRQVSLPKMKLAAVDADGKNFKDLIDIAPALGAKFDSGVIERSAKDSRKVFLHMDLLPPMGLNLAVSPDQPISNFELDIYTGKLQQLNEFGRGLWNQYSDGHGSLRLADGPDSRRRNLYAGKGDGKWEKLDKASEFFKTNPFVGFGVNAATGRAYGYADYETRSALWELDLDDNTPPAVAFSHPQVDVGRVLVDDAGQAIGVKYDTDRPFVEYIDEQFAAVMRGINKAMPNSFNSIHSTTADRKKLIIASRSDIDAGRFQLFDTETRKLSGIGALYPKLESQHLARMRTIEYPAQDGTKIPGYLLTPLDVRAEKLPLIVMPHSGYQGRAYWEYDMVGQFLASRGYAVVTMNFRGSSGYGKQWLEAGQEDWGGLIYSDITDAARWAVAQGVADPQRVCVLGRGASGYPALLGAIRNPDIYKCAASIGGRTDLIEFAKFARSFTPNKKSDAAKANSEKKANREDSPVQLAADVKTPVLLIHGTYDTRTPFAQSEDMAKALEKAGKNYKLVKIEKADYFFSRESERTTLLKELEQFFSANLGR